MVAPMRTYPHGRQLPHGSFGGDLGGATPPPAGQRLPPGFDECLDLERVEPDLPPEPDTRHNAEARELIRPCLRDVHAGGYLIGRQQAGHFAHLCVAVAGPAVEGDLGMADVPGYLVWLSMGPGSRRTRWVCLVVPLRMFTTEPPWGADTAACKVVTSLRNGE